MTEAKQVLLMLKGMVSELTPEQRARVEAACANIRAVVEDHGAEGAIALTIIGAELAVKN